MCSTKLSEFSYRPTTYTDSLKKTTTQVITNYRVFQIWNKPFSLIVKERNYVIRYVEKTISNPKQNYKGTE